jgi:hypothetical protein
MAMMAELIKEIPIGYFHPSETQTHPQIINYMLVLKRTKTDSQGFLATRVLTNVTD